MSGFTVKGIPTTNITKNTTRAQLRRLPIMKIRNQTNAKDVP